MRMKARMSMEEFQRWIAALGFVPGPNRETGAHIGDDWDEITLWISDEGVGTTNPEELEVEPGVMLGEDLHPDAPDRWDMKNWKVWVTCQDEEPDGSWITKAEVEVSTNPLES